MAPETTIAMPCDRNTLSILNVFHCRLHRAPSSSMRQPPASVAGCTRRWATDLRVVVPQLIACCTPRCMQGSSLERKPAL